MWPAFPAPEYYDPLRPPLGRPTVPGFASYIGGHRFPKPRRRRGRDGSPEFPGRPSARSTPATPEGSSAPAPRPRAPSMAFTVDEPARLPLPRPDGAGPPDDARSRFTRVADRTVASAPLRTRPLDHARGPHYQGPRRLPGPDSHRQAAPNLSLATSCRTPFPHGTEQSRRTRPQRERPRARGRHSQSRESAGMARCVAQTTRRWCR
jgi:hypothetical protein